ncbi:MAG: DUF4126 domain-containing protein [Candidatus Promineifilaceae bacterium]
MDPVSALGGIGSAFGLSSSAGLNAYIPLLIVALAGRLPANDPLIKLAEPYDALSSWWAIAFIVVMLLIEMTVDKIPAVDTVNDAIQTFIRPAAGAFLFAANASVITEMSPVIALLAGLLLAGGVHATKAAARPVVTASTVGTGNWLVSIVEDLIAAVVSVLAILIPILTLLIFGSMLLALILYLRRRRRRKVAQQTLV